MRQGGTRRRQNEYKKELKDDGQRRDDDRNEGQNKIKLKQIIVVLV